MLQSNLPAGDRRIVGLTADRHLPQLLAAADMNRRGGDADSPLAQRPEKVGGVVHADDELAHRCVQCRGN